MIYQRINLNPLARVIRPHGPHDGVPVRWEADDASDLPPLPSGEAWVVVEDRPAIDHDRQRLVRVLTTDRDGWRVVDLTPEEIAAKNPVAHSVTRRQLLLVLASLEPPILPSMIEAMIGDNQIGLIEFQNAGSFERSHPLVAELATALQMTPEDVDNIFRQASKL